MHQLHTNQPSGANTVQVYLVCIHIRRSDVSKCHIGPASKFDLGPVSNCFLVYCVNGVMSDVICLSSVTLCIVAKR